MKTTISIEGTKFLINERPTYEGISYKGKSIEGLLFNSRMIQAIFDDECAQTRALWEYPDTGKWDPQRNTDEFRAHLPEYRKHGLLGVTIGLQGGGSNYSPEIYDNYINSAFQPDGSFKKPYFERLLRIIKTADENGMIVIVNFFYGKQSERIKDDSIICNITEKVTDWLLKTGYKNILVDVANEAGKWWNRPIMEPENIPRLIEIVKQITLNNRRLLVSCSTPGGEHIPYGKWVEIEDFALPHGNGCVPDDLKTKLQKLKQFEEYKKDPHPIMINEDSIFVENMAAAIDEYCSWGLYCQGYGCNYKDRMDWTLHNRETEYENLSGFQTLPVNWGINTEIKKRFFDQLKLITEGA